MPVAASAQEAEQLSFLIDAPVSEFLLLVIEFLAKRDRTRAIHHVIAQPTDAPLLQLDFSHQLLL